MRFAETDALELVRKAAREPRVARHFAGLEPFGHNSERAEAFGRALLGLVAWLAERASRGSGRRAIAAASNAAVRAAKERAGSESELYRGLNERFSLDSFARRAADLLGLPEEDRWAAQALIVRTLAGPIRERVEALLRARATSAPLRA